MKKRCYKQFSSAGELQSIAVASSGLSGNVYAISRREYLLSLLALGLMVGQLPPDGVFGTTEAGE